MDVIYTGKVTPILPLPEGENAFQELALFTKLSMKISATRGDVFLPFLFAITVYGQFVLDQAYRVEQDKKASSFVLMLKAMPLFFNRFPRAYTLRSSVWLASPVEI